MITILQPVVGSGKTPDDPFRGKYSDGMGYSRRQYPLDVGLVMCDITPTEEQESVIRSDAAVAISG